MPVNPPTEFSRPIAVDDLKVRGNSVDIGANADERVALARRLGLLSVDSLSAEVDLGWTAGKALVRLEARLEADVVQQCVVTLKPLRAHIDVRFSRLYEPEGGDGEDDRELDIPPDEEDPPESFADDSIDIGEVVAEQLAIELNPFPRATDVAFEGYTCGPVEVEGTGGAENPFAALARLKRKQE
jgi:uncharacterized metal-binding protein YceD (DUF177 family)